MLDILLVEDEPGVRMSIAFPLVDAGHRVTEAGDGAEAVVLASKQFFDVVVCDVRLPKIDGLTLLRRLQREAPATAVVLMTAYGNVGDAVAALHEGAYDYVIKPFDTQEFTRRVIGRIAERRALEEQLGKARAALAGQDGVPGIIAVCPAMVRVIDWIETIAASEAPVLITGESGTGKELVARAVHERSGRKDGPFIAVNCAALPEPLIEAELFGHERGAFTGAVKKRDGRFKVADGGTLLLDEIGELPSSSQAKLLRVLQEGTVDPIGSDRSVPVDVRIISATHRNLKARVAEGRFREDLFFRLNVLDVVIPPLRERQGDLPLLFAHFMRRFTASGSPPTITPRAWQALRRYHFPGNVRELAHSIERALILARGGEIDLDHLPDDISGPSLIAVTEADRFLPLTEAARAFEREYVVRALSLAGGKKARAAELLGISRKTLWEKLRLHGLSESDTPPPDIALGTEPRGDDARVR